MYLGWILFWSKLQMRKENDYEIVNDNEAFQIVLLYNNEKLLTITMRDSNIDGVITVNVFL